MADGARSILAQQKRMSEDKNKFSVLALRGVRKSFRDPSGAPLDIIRIREFSLGAGEQAALVGHSGSGKSTLLNLIAGILLPDQGDILVCGENITKLSEARRDRFRAAHIGYVFQTFNLLQGFTALENVLLGRIFASGAGGDAKERAVKLLQTVGLGARLHHKPRALSTGEQQRVAIARALINTPQLVLADEPTANLDERNGAAVLELLQKVCAEHGQALLVATHDPDVMTSFRRVVKWEQLR
jgi:putative ABC transport system ATP-binding protein